MTLDELSRQLGQDNWTLSVKDAELAIHGKRRVFAPSMLAMLPYDKSALVGLIKPGRYAVLKHLECHEPENVIRANSPPIIREEVNPRMSGPCPASSRRRSYPSLAPLAVANFAMQRVVALACAAYGARHRTQQRRHSASAISVAGRRSFASCRCQGAMELAATTFLQAPGFGMPELTSNALYIG